MFSSLFCSSSVFIYNSLLLVLTAFSTLKDGEHEISLHYVLQRCIVIHSGACFIMLTFVVNEARNKKWSKCEFEKGES